MDPEKRRILVIDDEPHVREVLRALLESAHFDTDEMPDGVHVLSRVTSWRPDLVITDLVMPDAEGLSVIQQLRTRHPEVGIIAISGARGGAYLPAARAMGADATITKPFEAPALLGEVRRVLDLKRA